MEGGDGPGKSDRSDRVATIETLKKKEKRIRTKSSQQKDVIKKPNQKSSVESSDFRKSSSTDPKKRGWGHPDTMAVPLT